MVSLISEDAPVPELKGRRLTRRAVCGEQKDFAYRIKAWEERSDIGKR